MMSSRALRFGDRLLAEASAAREQLQTVGGAIDDRSANYVARAVDGDFEHRLVARAESLPFADILREALRNVRHSISLAIVVGIVLAGLGGAGAARAALGVPRDEPVNFFHVIASVLGVQTLLLLAWLALMCLPRSAAPAMSVASLGGIVLRAGQWLARRIHPGHDYAAAIAGVSRTLMQRSLGRWTFSAISHALWVSFNVGCLAMIVFLLSTRQYAFAWETTVLSERQYTPLTRVIASLPRLAGFVTPTDQQIAASQWTGDGRMNTDASQAWSGLLVGSMVVYGLGPRLLLLALSLGQRRVAKVRYRLDAQRPEFARQRGVLEPPTATTEVIDAEDAATPARTTPIVGGRASPRPFGLPAIIGYELPNTPAGSVNAAWPPRIHGVRWHDLGMVDSREDRHRVLNELSRGVQEPTTTLVVCSLTTTPDRGVATFLAELAARLTRPPALALSGGERLRQRAEHARLEVRVADWRAIAARAGIPDNRVVEIDFDHLTHNSLARLGAMIEAGSNGHVPTPALHERRLEDAFAAVVDYASRSEASGGAMSEDHTALHRAIARIYGNDGTDWQRLFRLPTSLASLKPADFPAALRSSAERFTSLLPARLRASPKWLAAGATTGALGCVAASALLSPVAISALPVWSLIGAAVAAAAQPPGKGDLSRTANTGAPSPNDQIVRSAALFAMLLEMQGRDEAIISRVLDRAIPDDLAEPSIPSAAQVRHWLDDLRHRFDVALEQETAA